MINSFSEQLIQEHAPTVRRLALRLASRLPPNVELDDLIQAGMIGLLDAARRYESQVGAQFSSYAITRINGAMHDELRAQDWLPRSVRHAGRALERAIHESSQELGRQPTDQEVADHMGISIQEYHKLLDDAQGIQIIHYENMKRESGDNETQPEGEAHILESVLASAYGDPTEDLDAAEFRGTIAKKIESLPEREKLVLSLYYEQDLNYKEVGKVLGISQGRVSQIHTKAIAAIRAMLADHHWDEAPKLALP